MIADHLNVFTDNLAVKTSGTSASVSLMPFMGKGEPVYVAVAVTEPYPATATISVAVQESADNSAFTALGSFDVPKETLKGGVYHFALPKALKKGYVRLAYTVGGSPATGRLFAGVTRDVPQAYEAGQYMSHGTLVA